MGQWQIRGADRSSGRDVGQIYDADTRDQAADLAVKDGMLVETIELLADDNTLPIEPLEPMDALEVALRREARANHSPAAPLEYGNDAFHRDRNEESVPTYSGLKVAGSVLRVFAFLYYLIALFLAVMEGLRVFEANRLPNMNTQDVMYTAWFLAVAVLGAFLHGAGSACFALRDMARNSWR